MIDFHVQAAEAVGFAAVPTVVLKLRIDAPGLRAVQSISLATQIRIAARQRAYAAQERERLTGVFGDPSNWSNSLTSLLWTNVTSVVLPFRGTTQLDLFVPCASDFEVVAGRYFHALDDGDVPLELLFSGAVFYVGDAGLQVERISWEDEAHFNLPMHVVHAAIEAVFPNTAWLTVRRDAFDRLAAYRTRHVLPSWEATIDALLATERVAEVVPS